MDEIGHEATDDKYVSKKICDVFGTEILDEDKKINRKKLGNFVFSNKENMDRLTEITWGYMQKRIDYIINKENEIVILDWALLPITKYWDMCNIKILAVSEQNKRKKKVIERDKITGDYYEKRESKSLDYKDLNFDFIWENNYQEKDVKQILKGIYKSIYNLEYKCNENGKK